MIATAQRQPRAQVHQSAAPTIALALSRQLGGQPGVVLAGAAVRVCRSGDAWCERRRQPPPPAGYLGRAMATPAACCGGRRQAACHRRQGVVEGAGPPAGTALAKQHRLDGTEQGFRGP